MINVDKMKKELDDKQRIVNDLYLKDGLTDEVLDKQLEINQLRNKYNIVDENTKVNGNFVQ